MVNSSGFAAPTQSPLRIIHSSLKHKSRSQLTDQSGPTGSILLTHARLAEGMQVYLLLFLVLASCLKYFEAVEADHHYEVPLSCIGLLGLLGGQTSFVRIFLTSWCSQTLDVSDRQCWWLTFYFGLFNFK